MKNSFVERPMESWIEKSWRKTFMVVLVCWFWDIEMFSRYLHSLLINEYKKNIIIIRTIIIIIIIIHFNKAKNAVGPFVWLRFFLLFVVLFSYSTTLPLLFMFLLIHFSIFIQNKKNKRNHLSHNAHDFFYDVLSSV